MECDSCTDLDYLTDFENFIHQEMNQNIEDDTCISHHSSKENLTELAGDLKQEAHDWIDQPTSSNIFYPNVESVGRCLKRSNAPHFKAYLRNKLESEIDRQTRMEMFGVPTSESTSPEAPSTHCASPDLFLESDEDEDMNAPGLGAKKIRTKQNLVALVEQFIMKMIHDLATDNNVNIEVANCEKWENCKMSDGILNLKEPAEILFRSIKLSRLQSRNRFALIAYILSEVYQLLITDTTCTERELYYKNPELVESQSNLKTAIRDICSALNVSPWELGICSSSKGLIAGAIRIHMLSNVVIDCFLYSGATLIPGDVKAITLIETTAKFVLIVEKDTIFERLLQQNVLLNLNSDVILITGRGFPDLSTRLLVKRLWNDFRLPIYMLVDADPFGIEIMFVYRFGSKAMVLNSDQLACPQIRWIGIQPSEIEMLAIPSVPQSKRDKKKATELLKRPYISAEIRNELETLQRLDRKAEIEGVASFSTNFLVSDYILNKIKRNFVI